MIPTSRTFYSPPQIDARDDGLCPTKLPDEHTGSVIATDEALVSYQTNSRVLNHDIREKNDPSVELEFICESISKFVMENVDEEEKKSALISVDFEISGCTWKMGLNPYLVAPGLQVQVTLFAKDDKPTGTIWVVQTCLVDIHADGSILSKSQLNELPLAKAVLEQTSLVIRKAVTKCEFPEFPEGGKGRAFKEVYKLNAKVR